MIPTLFLSIAKNTLLEHFALTSELDRDACIRKEPLLGDEGASFVTLHKDGALRGCIGSIIAHRSLFDDIVSNTLSAALHDPRFPPLRQEELSSLDVEVSVLTPPEEINYNDYEDLCKKIVVGKDGLILQHGGYQGTFLPQVWEQLPNVYEFLEQLSYKAGSSPDIYALHPKIFRYRVKAIEEPFDAIPPL
jgi:uncharacterized protein